MQKIIIISLLVLLNSLLPLWASQTQTRIDKDIAAGKPVVIQVSVALADNKHQWIVPVPDSIGNGQDARTNLYWGALYGVKTYMVKKAGWQKIASQKTEDKRILERLILKKEFLRKGITIPVYIIADAWDGKYISDTIKQFMRYNAGHDVDFTEADGRRLSAGGRAHLIVYIGHNALMDYIGTKKFFISDPGISKNNPVNDAIVLACKSQPYFSDRLKNAGAHPLVMTTGLMAPEAYTLDAAMTEWIEGGNDNQVRKAAAKSYHKYQKTGIKAAERLFGVK